LKEDDDELSMNTGTALKDEAVYWEPSARWQKHRYTITG